MTLDKEFQAAVSRTDDTNKRHKNSLRGKMRHLLLLAVSGGALIASPQLARAEFTPNPSAPNYIASGNETTPQTIIEDNVQVTTGEDFSIETDDGTALTIEGAGAIGYNDANESRLVSTVTGNGLLIKSTGDALGTPGAVTVVSNGTIQGAGTAIEAINNGTGNMTITTTGTVTGTSEDGIYASNSDSSANLTLNVATVTGQLNGILTRNAGVGDTTITATGTVTGTDNIGIDAGNSASAGDLTVNAVDVTGFIIGINASNNGTGDTTVTATGTVIGTAASGIIAMNGDDAHDITIKAAAVTGGVTGIEASSSGIGDISITATGDVTGGTSGITVSHNGTGNTSVTATGTVVGTATDGINAFNNEAANDVTVNAVAASGGYSGIIARNLGTGNTSVTATGLVTGSALFGVSASNTEQGKDVTVHIADVIGNDMGVQLINNGTGDSTITATGTVEGTNLYGIYAENRGSQNDLTINVVDVTSNKVGIRATGTGDTSITATGTVSGLNNGGIIVSHLSETAGHILVDAMNVNGGQVGISVSNSGTGNTTVTARGTVTSTSGRGIDVSSDGSANDLAVNVVDVGAATNGIEARNYGLGDTRITATGQVTGTQQDGIFAENGETAGDLTMDVVNVSGGLYGINAINNGVGSATISVEGVVEGGEAGILANSSGSQPIEININGTVRNSSQSSTGLAIESESGSVVINNNRQLLGTIALSDQGNTVNNNGVWDVAGGTSSLGEGANLIDNRSGGTILAANAQGPVTTTFTGVDTLVHSGEIVLQNQEAGGQTAYVGDIAIFTNGGSGNFQSNGGRILLDTDFETGTSDRLVVDNVSVASEPTRVYIKPVNAVTSLTAEGINVVEVLGDSADNAFVMGNSVGRGLYSYQIGRGLSEETEQNWYLRESSEIRGEVPMASALTVLAGRTSLATLSSMHERQREGGDEADNYASLSGTRMVSRSTTVTLPEADRIANKGVWGRVFGQSNEFNSESGAGYDTRLWGAQAGIDLIAKGSQNTGRTYAGVYLGHASSNGDGLRGNTRLGTLKVDATSLGAYYTHINSSGLYWDAVAQYSRISDAKLKYLGETTETEGSSYLASLEAGKQFNRDSKYVAELQGQLLYQKTSIDEMRLADSTRFDVGSQSGVTGRVGVRLARNPHQGASVQPWLRADLWRTFNQDVRVSSLGESVTTPAGGTTGEVQVGFSLVPQSSGGWSAYVAGGYQFDVSGSEYSGWKGALGVRKGW